MIFLRRWSCVYVHIEKAKRNITGLKVRKAEHGTLQSYLKTSSASLLWDRGGGTDWLKVGFQDFLFFFFLIRNFDSVVDLGEVAF